MCVYVRVSDPRPKYNHTISSKDRYMANLLTCEDVHFEANCFNFAIQIAIIFRFTKNE